MVCCPTRSRSVEPSPTANDFVLRPLLLYSQRQPQGAGTDTVISSERDSSHNLVRTTCLFCCLMKGLGCFPNNSSPYGLVKAHSLSTFLPHANTVPVYRKTEHHFPSLLKPLASAGLTCRPYADLLRTLTARGLGSLRSDLNKAPHSLVSGVLARADVLDHRV